MFARLPPGFPAVPRYVSHTCDMDALQISQGKPQNVPRVDAGLITHIPCGWRTSQSRARSSRVYHTSYPVPVRRPARLDWASSRPHLAVDALALLLAFGSSYTWLGDFHPDSSVPCPAHTFTLSGAPLAGASALGRAVRRSVSSRALRAAPSKTALAPTRASRPKGVAP